MCYPIPHVLNVAVALARFTSEGPQGKNVLLGPHWPPLYSFIVSPGNCKLTNTLEQKWSVDYLIDRKLTDNHFYNWLIVSFYFKQKLSKID